MGGRVGLKGSDGRDILQKAQRLGAKPEAPERALRALQGLVPLAEGIELFTCPFEMGEDVARRCGFRPIVIGTITRGRTTARDTRKAAHKMMSLEIDLLLFAGGDGTARDICGVLGDRIPALGIPTGVKMHSAVYATSPRNAGELARLYLDETDPGIRLAEAEVMDIDEASFRENRLSASLYGYLNVPYKKRLLQCPKAGGCAGEQEALDAIATDVISGMERDCVYVIGTGTTTRAVMDKLGLPNTLLGVDALCNRALLGSDLNESQILALIRGRRAKIVVGIIGRQGYVFGRGNQQLSGRVIRECGKDNILVVGTMEKILTLGGEPLLVDTGEADVDEMLRGYARVTIGLGESLMLRVEA